MHYRLKCKKIHSEITTYTNKIENWCTKEVTMSVFTRKPRVPWWLLAKLWARREVQSCSEQPSEPTATKITSTALHTYRYYLRQKCPTHGLVNFQSDVLTRDAESLSACETLDFYSRVRIFRNPDSNSGTKNPGLWIWIQNQTPTLELIVSHTDCVLEKFREKF